MRILHGIESLSQSPHGGVLLIGNFDGIHRGHSRLLEWARQLATAGQSDGASSVTLVTFEPHPLTVLRPSKAPGRLTPLERKQELLAAAGVDCLVILPPTPLTLDMTAEQFWQRIRDNARPRHVVEGSNFTFGKNRGGTIERLRQWAARDGVELHVVDPVSVPLLDLHIVPVSSSLVRWLLLNGRARDAAIALGRPYVLAGQVIEGFKRGRTIGVPTANLHIAEQLVPADGVYAGRCTVGGTTYPAAVSIGLLPTFDQQSRQIEAHLIGFDGDLYGQTLSVELLDWLRDQRKFTGIPQLKQAMDRDLERSRQWATRDPAAPLAHA